MAGCIHTNMLRFVAALSGMLLVLASGVGKLLDVRQFQQSLQLWQALPENCAPVLAIVVPSVEVFVAGAWVASLWRARMRILCVLSLMLWTGAYVVEAILYAPPICNCFGRLVELHEFEQSIPAVLARNSLIILALAFGSDRAKALGPERRSDDISASTERRGFTLIETLLVIVVVGLLVVMLNPILSKTRDQMKATQAIATLRSHGAVIASYGIDYKDTFPCIADPLYTHTLVKSGAEEWLMGYFDVRFSWWFGLADAYYGGRTWDPSFFAPSRGRAKRGEPYWYSLGCVARPEYWSLSTRRPLGQFGAMSQADVLTPSKKGVLVNWEEPFRGRGTIYDFARIAVPVQVGLCDGSAQNVDTNSLMRPIGDGEGPVSWPYTRMGWGIPIVHTVDGIRGRDVQ